MMLYKFQEELNNKVRRLHKYGVRKVGVKSPCGSGKTVMACDLIKSRLEAGQRSIFIVDRIELINQASEKLFSNGIEHGIIQGSNAGFMPSAKVHVASVQTLARRGFEIDVSFGVVDEFHSVYAYNKRILENTNIDFVGMSATPFTKGLGLSWDALVTGPTVQELIDMSRLSPLITYSPFIFDTKGVKHNANDFNQLQLNAKVNQKTITADVVNTWLSLGEGRKTICFAINVDHARELVIEFTLQGVKARHIDWRTDKDERLEILNDFADGDLEIICNVDILTKGYDNPIVSCIIDAAPTLSLIRHVQKIGRGARTYQGKDNCIILDHAGNTCRHGNITDQTPDSLDLGKGVLPRKTEREYQASVQRVCNKCKIVKPDSWGRECQSCGYSTPAPKPDSKVQVKKGVLVKNDNNNGKNKAEWLGMFIWYANYKSYKIGWAFHAYKNRFKHWPNNYERDNCVKKQPNLEVKNYIKHMQIANRKSGESK